MRVTWARIAGPAVLALTVLFAPTAFAADTDRDGSTDVSDNCPAVANPKQLDGDADGIGNACDGDFNNDGKVDAADSQLLTAALAGTTCLACDLDESGAVTVRDYALHGRMVLATQ